MEKAVVKKEGLIVIRNADIASGFFERLRGLMFAQSIPDNYGLVIRPCDQIHMFHMKFPLDVIYLSADGTVLRVDENMRPWSVGKRVGKAAGVIEVNAGICARNGIAVGDVLTVETVQN